MMPAIRKGAAAVAAPGLDFDDAVQEGPVSYTHLDVYKRQLLHNDSPAKFITIGEVMLRLTPPNYEKIRMASNFEASYGGSEANIALALSLIHISLPCGGGISAGT